MTLALTPYPSRPANASRFEWGFDMWIDRIVFSGAGGADFIAAGTARVPAQQACTARVPQRDAAVDTVDAVDAVHAPGRRLRSLDVLRGVAVALMILADNPGEP